MKHGRFLSLRVVVATPSMRETAVPLTVIRYMSECSIYNLIRIEIRLKLKLKPGDERIRAETVEL